MTDDGLENVEELDVDGMKDRTLDIWYIGKAHKQPDGKWRCLADVNGALCLVEVRIRVNVPVDSIEVEIPHT